MFLKLTSSGATFLFVDAGVLIEAAPGSDFTEAALLRILGGSQSLRSLVTAGSVIVDAGGGPLSVADALKYLNQVWLQSGGDVPVQMAQVSGEITDIQHGTRSGDLHPDYQKESEKNQPNGYAGLNGSSQVPAGSLGQHSHASHSGIGPDDHHAKSHAHDGVDGSGTVAHSATTGKTANDHHAQSHAHNGVDGSGTVAHSDVTGKTANDHHPQSHSHASHTGIGADDHHARQHTMTSASDHTGSIDDTQHGSRGGGTLHPTATGALAGFMAAADKTKLNGLVALTNTIAEADSNITTTSATPVLATGMTLTPAAGTYLCLFQGSVYQDTTGAGLYVEMSLYAGGGQLTHSRHRAADAPTFDQAFTCVGIATVNGSQAIEGRWRRTAGSGTAYMRGPRSLIVIRVA